MLVIIDVEIPADSQP